MTSNATIPGEEIPEHFYDAAPLEPHLLYQGEILVDVPILNMPKPTLWLLLRTVKSGRRVHEAIENGSIQGTIRVLDSKTSLAQWYADGNGDYAMGLLDKKPVLVLSQTCDSQNKDFIQVAPILPVGQIDAEELANLKNGGVMNAFWLAPHPPEIPEQSFANLTLIQSIHNTYIRHVHSSDFLRNSISG